jgi:catechol 2,3-dioxygenase-like lactoylglutathione lyase family enzyme
MHFSLDHVVIAVKDLGRAVEDYQALGFTVVVGGRHPPPRTSSNALIVFEDGAYLELISWDPPNPAERWSNLLQEHGEGYVDFALIPENLPQAIEEAKARGLHLNGPIDGRRERPDGVEVRWQTARQATFDLPFLCADLTPREIRVPSGAMRKHANGASGVSKVVVAVTDLAASVTRYEALLGNPAERRENTIVFVLDGTLLCLGEDRGAREGVRSITLAGLHDNVMELHDAAILSAG